MMTDQIDIEELIEEVETDAVAFKTNIPPKWNVSLDDCGYKQLPNGTEFVHDDVRNIKLFEDVGTVEPTPLLVNSQVFPTLFVVVGVWNILLIKTSPLPCSVEELPAPATVNR